VCRAARSDGAVDCTHATTQDNAAAAVRMLHLQVSSPVFRSTSITHSITMHRVLNAFSVRKRQADSELRAAGRIALSTSCTVMLQAEHCSLCQKCAKQREIGDNKEVNSA
jgi:hypothetical protein